jgi:hypothetical protein
MDEMTLKKVLIWAVLVVMYPLSSCNLEDDSVNFHFVNLKVVDVSLPEYFELYESYEIQVTYLRPNNCTIFDGFNIEKSGPTTRDVVAVGTELEHSNCVEIGAEATETFTFTCHYSDSYTFRFWSGVNPDGSQQFLEYQVPVSGP